MFAFIIRRLLATVLLLVLVSFITFLIFFELPKLAGQTTYALAVQYAGRSPTPATVHAVEHQLGLDQPWWEQFGKFIWSIVAGKHSNSRQSQIN